MTLLHQAAQKAVEAKQREAFEHWYSEAGRWPKSVARGDDGHYLLAQANSSYEAWRAAVSALQQQEVPREPPESELVCYEAYAALGMFLMELAEGGHPQAEKLLDNLSQARLAHKDVLPFSPSTTQQQEAGSDDDGGARVQWTGSDGTHHDVIIEYALQIMRWVFDKWDVPEIDAMLAAAPSTPESAEKDDAGGGKACPGDGCNGCAGCWKVSETPSENTPGVRVDGQALSLRTDLLRMLDRADTPHDADRYTAIKECNRLAHRLVELATGVMVDDAALLKDCAALVEMVIEAPGARQLRRRLKAALGVEGLKS